MTFEVSAWLLKDRPLPTSTLLSSPQVHRYPWIQLAPARSWLCKFVIDMLVSSSDILETLPAKPSVRLPAKADRPSSAVQTSFSSLIK